MSRSKGERPKSPSRDEYLACQLPSWYPFFSGFFPNRKKGLTFQSRILSVPDAFLLYLTEDGVRLPPNTKTSTCLECKPQKHGTDSDHDNNDDDCSWSNDSSEQPQGDDEERPAVSDLSLNSLTDEISIAIRELGGSVIPKLNWSSPKDSSWINEGTLKCQTAGDIYLLLKSSDFVSSDLELLDSMHDDEHPISIQLVIRKWANLYPCHEFRCYVFNHRLVAVSQRHADQHFESLPKDKENLVAVLEEFLEVHVFHRFASGAVGNYVMDAYVDRHDRVWIIDFNVWGNRTDSLLFDWDELNSWGGDDDGTNNDRECEIRVVETAKEVKTHPLNNFRAPVDTVHIASITGGKPSGFQTLMDLCLAQEDKERYDDEPLH